MSTTRAAILRSPAAGPVLGAGILLVALGALTLALDGTARLATAGVGTAAIAGAGGLGCLRASRRTVRRTRRGWLALAVACWSWSAGQVVAVVLGPLLGTAVPYPSPADLGYLGFPVAALVGLLYLAPAVPALAAHHRVLDAVMVGCAIGLLAWLGVSDTMTDHTVTDGPDPLFDSVVQVAYPVADVVLLTATVLVVAHTRDHTRQWGLLGTAVLLVAVSDAAFLHQIAAGTSTPGSLPAWGWRIAFCLFAVAGLLVTGDPDPAVLPETAPTVRAVLLPYLPLSGAVVAAILTAASDEGLDPIAASILVVLVVVVLPHQFFVIRQNRRLADTVRHREAQLHHLAFHDGLTGLANRALFLDRLGHAIDVAARAGVPVSLAFLDLDGFKAVNDALGHGGGDALLVQVGERLRATLRTADTLARLGGDEFAVLVEEGDDAGVVAHRLLDALRPPFHIDGRTIAISASVGVASLDPGQELGEPGWGTSAATLLHRADVAMYTVKNSGKDDVAVHSPGRDHTGRDVATRRGGQLHRAFAAALDHGEVRAVYQPVVDPVSGRIGTLEALARWTHEGADVPPAVFIPICEQLGLSEQLTTVMLEQACTQLALWNRGLEHRSLRVAVNVNPTEFSDTGLPERIARLQARHDLGPGQLALEMTEVALSNRPEAALDVMNRLRGHGVRLALDDFGTGYSTLARLASTPMDTVKIDRFFVADIDHDEHQRRFLAGLLDLTRHLGLRSVAEGVERAGQLRVLRRLRCDLVQGHFVARPATAAALTPIVLAEQPIIPAHLRDEVRLLPADADH